MGIEGIEEIISDPTLSDEEVVEEQRENEQLVIEEVVVEVPEEESSLPNPGETNHEE